jgi:hypothetical protein
MLTFDIWLLIAACVTALFVGTLLGLWIEHALHK